MWELGRTRSWSARRQATSKDSPPSNGFAGFDPFRFFSQQYFLFTGAVSLWARCRIAGLPCTHLSLVLRSLFIQPGSIHPYIHPSIHPYISIQSSNGVAFIQPLPWKTRNRRYGNLVFSQKSKNVTCLWELADSINASMFVQFKNLAQVLSC